MVDERKRNWREMIIKEWKEGRKKENKIEKKEKVKKIIKIMEVGRIIIEEK